MPLILKGIPRFKLKNPIFPNVEVLVKIKYIKDCSKILFEFIEFETGKVFSNGKILLEDNDE